MPKSTIKRNPDAKEKKLFAKHTELWDVIEQHIRSDKCVLVAHPEGSHLRGSSADGPVRFKECLFVQRRYPQGEDVIETFYIEVDVKYWGQHEDDFLSESYRIYIPAELVREFSKKAFNAWVAKIRGQVKAIIRKYNEAEYKRLGKVLDKK